MSELWHGFPLHSLTFENHEAMVVSPREERSNGRLAVKTEYWDAFPHAVETGLLELGFHLCFIRNDNRWDDSDPGQTGFHWLYTYREGTEVPEDFEIVDFCGGLYAVATDIDGRTD